MPRAHPERRLAVADLCHREDTPGDLGAPHRPAARRASWSPASIATVPFDALTVEPTGTSLAVRSSAWTTGYSSTVPASLLAR